MLDEKELAAFEKAILQIIPFSHQLGSSVAAVTIPGIEEDYSKKVFMNIFPNYDVLSVDAFLGDAECKKKGGLVLTGCNQQLFVQDHVQRKLRGFIHSVVYPYEWRERQQDFFVLMIFSEMPPTRSVLFTERFNDPYFWSSKVWSLLKTDREFLLNRLSPSGYILVKERRFVSEDSWKNISSTSYKF